MTTAKVKRRKRPKVQSSKKIQVIAPNGSCWVEERCWRCGRVLNKHSSICSSTKIKRVNCPSCKAVNIVEDED